MIRNRILLRSIAVFLVLETMFSTVAPTISWALTSGPSAPEFSSFEPVDTSDMVNLATGGLVHNIPLLEVPGPAGGFPLSASYHAGIMTEQESSWIGLGWTMNVGAINRTTNGFADDSKNTRREVRDYWDGGATTTKTYSLGLSIPRTGIGINYELARSRDTFKGFSINHYAAVTAGGVSVDTRGNVTVSADPVRWAIGLTGNSNLSQSYNSLSGLMGGNAVGLNISSKGVKAVLTLGGNPIIQHNNSAGTISSYTTVTNIGAIPLFTFGSFSMKDYYTRYWSNQSDALYAYGSLYAAESNDKEDHMSTTVTEEDDNSYTEFRSYANDVYDLYDIPGSDENAWDFYDDADPAKQSGGSLPSYDRYDVLGQGIGGIIEPAIFENGDIRGQNSYLRNPAIGTPITDHPTLKYNTLKKFTTDKKVDFRFKNDFSNKLTLTPQSISSTYSVSNQVVSADADGFESSPTRQMLEGSRHVDWFTNKQIRDDAADHFIDCYANKSDRRISMDIYDNYLQPEACVPMDERNHRGKGSGMFKTDTYAPAEDNDEKYHSLKPRSISLEDKIGGFMITNESGVTYHYALPVYAYNEYTRTKMKKPLQGSATINEMKNDEPYAYTWLLTAITGPDYVDRGGAEGAANGILDESDFGYWVKFDYGRWADSYQWRTPHSGYNTDMESEYATFSYGIKELYYLDAIETKTHKAIFIKSKRKDGRGVTSRLEGGSNPRKYKMDYEWHVENAEMTGNLTFSVSPVSTMKLDAIYLFDKKELSGVAINKNNSDKYDHFPTGSPKAFQYLGNDYSYQAPMAQDPITIKEGEDFIKVNYHNGDLVYDDGDIQGLANFATNALRIIQFNTDYSLGQYNSTVPGNFLKGVPNSFDNYSVIADQWNRSCLPLGCEGETQLTDFEFEWPAMTSGCYSSNPSCCNVADADAFYSADPLFRFQSVNVCSQEDNFAGKDLTYFRTGKLTLNSIKVLGHGGADMIPATKFAYNKNVSYNMDKFDEWGYYKSDYHSLDGEDFTSPIVGSRKITSASANNVDAWSLGKIISPLGGSIELAYEANQYRKSVYNDTHSFGIEKVQLIGSDYVRVFFNEKGFDLKNFFSASQSIEVRAFIVSLFGSTPNTFPDYFINNCTVTSVADDNLILSSSALNALLQSGRQLDLPGSPATTAAHFISGVVNLPDISTVKYAGGVRVKSVKVEEFGGHHLTTEYSYGIPNSNLSSGITSFKPYKSIGVNYPTEVEAFRDILSDNEHPERGLALMMYKTKFTKLLNRLNEKLLIFGRETPAPGVIYEYVTVKNKYDGNPFDQYLMYQFEVFDEDMISLVKNEYGIQSNQRSNVDIVNRAVGVGNLKKVMTFSGSDLLMHETKYGYLYDDQDLPFEENLKNIGQGILQQSFHKYISVKEYYNHGVVSNGYDIETVNSSEKAVVTTRKDYSNAMTLVEEIDYKSGIKSETQYRGFDFYSGQPVETLTKNPDGKSFLTETVPAYSISNNNVMVYPGMGLKLKNPENKHMITQPGATYVFKLDANDAPTKVVSGSVQTWSQGIAVVREGQSKSEATAQQNVWRKQGSYSFIGSSGSIAIDDGLVPFQNLVKFDAWDNSTITSGWQKDSDVKLYDVYSNALEVKDINSQSATAKMSYDHTKVFAVANNSGYEEAAFSGAEEILSGNGSYGGGVLKSDGLEVFRQPSNENAEDYEKDHTTTHTGDKALALSQASKKAFLYSFTTVANRSYHASVWVNSPSGRLHYKINGAAQSPGAPVEAKKAGSWYLVTVDIPAGQQSASLEIWCETTGAACHFDDFRVHPTDAGMTSYVYNKWGELSHLLDQNNFYTEYEYDKAGRLVKTYKESFQFERSMTSKIRYNYAGKD